MKSRRATSNNSNQSSTGVMQKALDFIEVMTSRQPPKKKQKISEDIQKALVKQSRNPFAPLPETYRKEAKNPFAALPASSPLPEEIEKTGRVAMSLEDEQIAVIMNSLRG